MKKVLIACEFSGVVREAFKKQGFDVWSCDIIPSDIPGNHIQGDVLDVLDDGWDLMIAHPPCTYLCSAGNAFLNNRLDLKWRENRVPAVSFFMKLINSKIPLVAVENPVGCLNTMYRKPDQIVRPWWFGDKYKKDICLWLRGLPLLVKTGVVSGPYGKIDLWSTKRNVNGRSIKSITFPGVAAAMADQWGFFLKHNKEQGGLL